MNRTLIKDTNLIIDGSNIDHSFAVCKKDALVKNINIKDNATLNLIIDDVENASEFLIDLGKNAVLELSILLKNNIKSLKLSANLAENAQIIVHCADFSVQENNLDVSINLNGFNASAKWKLASLSGDKDNKKIFVNINHYAPGTYAKVDNYGVSKDDSKLLFAGTSNIVKGAHASKTYQNAKIMVFDERSIAIAKPILKIDENDIEASHSAGVGKISDEHLFYLTSRGLTTIEARQLITMGYLKPILVGFTEDEYKNEIIKLIERRL